MIAAASVGLVVAPGTFRRPVDERLSDAVHPKAPHLEHVLERVEGGAEAGERIERRIPVETNTRIPRSQA